MRILAILFLILTLPLVAYDDRPPCYKDLERDFFHFKILGEAFSNWLVPQGQWDPIFRMLVDRQEQAEYVINEGARRYSPNPLQNPFQSDVARDLLHQTMYQIFERCMLESGFFDTVSIARMFEYIWTHDLRIKNCLPVE